MSPGSETPADSVEPDDGLLSLHATVEGMRTIDAAHGGGQLVRWALGFASAAGDPVELTGIRAARPNPGLGPQHLAVVRLLEAVTEAEVDGASEGSERLVFDPGAVDPGEYEVSIGTAGSVALVFDAALSLAPVLEDPLAVTATGGTDVEWSPPIDYLAAVKLPLLRAAGLEASLEVDRRGFYPEGGGRATLRVAPIYRDLDLAFEGDSEVQGARVYSTATADLADAEVPTRQAEAARERLLEAGIDVRETIRSVVEARSTGSVVVVRLDADPVPAGFSTLGAPGRPAEDVGRTAAAAAVAFGDGPGVVDEHMADQLVPFAALSGGRVPVPVVTDHLETGAALARAFGHEVRVDESGPTPVLVG